MTGKGNGQCRWSELVDFFQRRHISPTCRSRCGLEETTPWKAEREKYSGGGKSKWTFIGKQLRAHVTQFNKLKKKSSGNKGTRARHGKTCFYCRLDLFHNFCENERNPVEKWRTFSVGEKETRSLLNSTQLSSLGIVRLSVFVCVCFFFKQ